ncbi:MAG: L,D-transpeptidase [Microthrixaceae bacterium]
MRPRARPDKAMPRWAAGLGLAVSSTFLVAGCTDSAKPRPEGSAPLVTTPAEEVQGISPRAVAEGVPDWRSYVATAKAELGAVPVFDAVGGAQQAIVEDRSSEGFPAVFLVRELDVDDAPDGEVWHEVWLPIRPNGSHGFVRDDDVTLSYHDYRLSVDLSDHEVRLYTAGVLTETYLAGVGTDRTPTPGGTFYTKELLRPTNRGGPYGTHAYGLSGFSNTLTQFAGSDGVVGLHGTDDPDSVGKDVSAGCIRLQNADIDELVDRLPLGVPVDIVA